MPAPTDVSNDEEGAIVNRRNAAQGNVNDWATTGLSFLSSFATIALGIGLAVVANEYNNVQKDHNKAVLQEQKRHNEVVEKKKQEEIALKEKEFESQTQAYFDSMIKDIIAAPYTPSTPKSYVARQQDEALGEALRENIEDTNHKFFMLVGESGSGKTTMMQNLLRKEYGKGGVLELSLSAETFVKLRAEGTPFVAQLEQSIWSLFKDCATHNKRERNLVKFVNHANEVWKKARGKDYAHPLIIYITLESKYDLDSDTMKDFSGTFSSLPTLLSSKTDSCKVIVEVSKTAISDKIEKDHPSDQTSLKVEAMTEDEFLRIGEQLLTMEDPQNLTAPYLKYYHDWLGGHTKALAQLVDQKAKFKCMHNLFPGPGPGLDLKLHLGVRSSRNSMKVLTARTDVSYLRDYKTGGEEGYAGRFCAFRVFLFFSNPASPISPVHSLCLSVGVCGTSPSPQGLNAPALFYASSPWQGI